MLHFIAWCLFTLPIHAMGTFVFSFLFMRYSEDFIYEADKGSCYILSFVMFVMPFWGIYCFL